MKFTTWERNNIHALLGNMQRLPVSDLEIVLSLRKKFNLSDSEKNDWSLYDRLCANHNGSKDHEKLLKEHSQKMHEQTIEITLSSNEFQFLHTKLTGKDVQLPATENLIEHSIRFIAKIKNTKTKSEEI